MSKKSKSKRKMFFFYSHFRGVCVYEVSWPILIYKHEVAKAELYSHEEVGKKEVAKGGEKWTKQL